MFAKYINIRTHSLRLQTHHVNSETSMSHSSSCGWDVIEIIDL